MSKTTIRDRLRSLLALNEPPHRIALAFAVGVFIAFSPTVGLHTLSCLLVIWLFRFNTLVVFTAAFLNNPWTIVPMYGFCLWFGVKLTGSEIATPDIPWGQAGVKELITLLSPYLWPFVAGTVVAGTVASLLSYAFVYWAVVRYRKPDIAS